MANFTLPALPYATDALEPQIDQKTMEIHHGKHHQTYVDKLNAALEGHDEIADKGLTAILADLDSVPTSIRTAVRNNGGGHFNHTLFWEVIAPGSNATKPEGKLAQAIEEAFGSFEQFKEAFTNAATTRFGSGWAWLAVNSDGKLEVTSTPNQDNPISEGKTAILGIDVWEHAYYLNYQNRRPDYIANFYDIINWEVVAEKYAAAV